MRTRRDVSEWVRERRKKKSRDGKEREVWGWHFRVYATFRIGHCPARPARRVRWIGRRVRSSPDAGKVCRFFGCSSLGSSARAQLFRRTNIICARALQLHGPACTAVSGRQHGSEPDGQTKVGGRLRCSCMVHAPLTAGVLHSVPTPVYFFLASLSFLLIFPVSTSPFRPSVPSTHTLIVETRRFTSSQCLTM